MILHAVTFTLDRGVATRLLRVRDGPSPALRALVETVKVLGQPR